MTDPTATPGPAMSEGPDSTDGGAASAQALRVLEAVLFAAGEPLDRASIAERLAPGSDIDALLAGLERHYAARGINLVRVAGRYSLRTATDLAGALEIERAVTRKLSRAAIETLAIIAYHQPITRAEIENIRGVSLSRGTLDTILEIGWVKPKGHRETPGRPATWVTTEAFLSHFGLERVDDLPGLEDLKAAGLLDARPAVSAYGERAELDAEPSEDGEDGEDGEDAEDSPIDAGRTADDD